MDANPASKKRRTIVWATAGTLALLVLGLGVVAASGGMTPSSHDATHQAGACGAWDHPSDHGGQHTTGNHTRPANHHSVECDHQSGDHARPADHHS